MVIGLDQPLLVSESYKKIKSYCDTQRLPILVAGCVENQDCHVMYNIGKDYKNRIIVVGDDTKAKELYENYRYFDDNVYVFPAKDVLFYSADVHGNAITRQRIKLLKALTEEEACTVIVPIDVLMEHFVPLKEFKNHAICVKVGTTLDLGKLRIQLMEMGYEKTSMIDGVGQYSIRGGIVDIYPLTEDCPYRIELWGDEVDSIRSFDVESQRSIENMEEFTIYPAAELVLSEQAISLGMEKIEKEAKAYMETLRKQMKTEEAYRVQRTTSQLKEELVEFHSAISTESYIHYFCQELVPFVEYFDKKDSIFFVVEPNRIIEKAEAYELEFREGMVGRLEGGYILPSQTDLLYSAKEAMGILATRSCVLFSLLLQQVEEFDLVDTILMDAKSVAPYHNDFERVVKDIKNWREKGYRIVVMSPSKTRAKRLVEDLRNYDLEGYFTESLDKELLPRELVCTVGHLNKGFEYPSSQFVVVSESDMFYYKDKKKKRKKTSNYSGSKINSFSDISIGDYVVHENHGLGVYKGIEKIEVDHVIKDYLTIEYSGGSNLFVPVSSLDMIQKYASSSARRPKLNKLGGKEWEKTKTRVKTQVNKIAKELVDLYAIRQSKEGHAFSKDTVWQQEFEEMFPYEETNDQLNAIEATKQDMESTKIMDRLICGDVGYGKTEVAIRAAFKAVADGKQVAFLVPTTILAQQHYNTFVERMKNFPINICMMSRFQTRSQQQKNIEKLKNGMMDIVIGTHRILSKDIEYKDLGLLIIDEEQRFGVTHKEKIKTIKKDVDVLALSATPIPRTLHMSLIGIRDMSVLEEPPVDRRAIQTYVLEYNEQLVKEAIHRELARNGQVYYVYNRVNNIEEITNQLAKLVPEARVSFAHGQMSERELEKIMFDFINGEIQVLVSTTIIETGLDIPNVNTMIIHDANQLGLSQLYQLRGRVGRSNRTAYAFLMYKRDTMLKETAEKRLQAIREFTDLGSGFKIAMRDLEIRGAGNLLGEAQSGHMEAVGYDLYCKMLNDAVKRMKGDIVEEEFETSIDLPVDAYIPASYVKNEFQKLELYKRISNIANEEEYEDLMDEIVDRYGELPKSVVLLLQVALLKAKAHDNFIAAIEKKGVYIHFTMAPCAKVKVEQIEEFLKKNRPNMKLLRGEQPGFQYEVTKIPKKDLLNCVQSVINDVSDLIER
ncbi:MAG: transcription-repair coupling factor [Lachnospiraceae bacterium]|nr:transcription-repair coupling factor [Lachnospiraceae bacterium]